MNKHLFLICLLLASLVCYSQVPDSSGLYKMLQIKDSLVFEQGFNKCNLSVYDSLISDDLEFYHDKAGITIGKAAFIASVKNNICASKNMVRRELVPGSLMVFPLYKNTILYGAIQAGAHKFFILENSTWNLSGTARFTHLWLLNQGTWKLKRVLSYDHL